jgi:nucleoside-diphosphate-sugar epimerase
MNLVTGISSGLGKYLYRELPNSVGLGRNNFSSIQDFKFDTIIHCAFNKETQISDYKRYLDDNILLTQRLKKLKYNKFVYISSVDVYQSNLNIYSIFKKLSETLINKEDLILRCPMLLGNTMKSNHVTKLFSNIESIGLSGESEFNYILMEDLANFFHKQKHKNYLGVVDFVSSSSLKLKELKHILNSTTKLGNHVYNNNLDFVNPIHILDEDFNISSLSRIKKYYK